MWPAWVGCVGFGEEHAATQGHVLGGGKQAGHPRHPCHAEDTQEPGDPATTHQEQHISEQEVPPADREMAKPTSWLGDFTYKTRNRVADRVLGLQPGVRLEPLRCESRVQDTGPPETALPHIISIGESSPRDLCLNTNTQLHPMASKRQCWMPHAQN